MTGNDPPQYIVEHDGDYLFVVHVEGIVFFYISDLDLAYLGVTCLGMALPGCDLPGLGVVFLGVMILKLILSTFQSSDLFVVHEEGIVF